MGLGVVCGYVASVLRLDMCLCGLAELDCLMHPTPHTPTG